MSSASAPSLGRSKLAVSPQAISASRAAFVIGVTLLMALAAYYFVGVDEGTTSVFGKTLVLHEWVHDSRHLLGFPCH